jgi:D-alanine-D-alanine ligase
MPFMHDLLILINAISEQPTRDELDVMVQADAVEQALKELGYSTRRAPFGLDLEPVAAILENHPPDLVFNLVETVGGKGALIHLCPSLLDAFGIPYTGSGTYALVVTTDKIRTKQILEEHGIPTPEWLLPGSGRLPSPGKKYIIKPIWEDGSAGISDDSVIDGKVLEMNGLPKEGVLRDAFLEEYIDGREFNLSLLADHNGPAVMPAAEMLYVDYPAGKPKILNFASKWDEASFEYHKTVRTFDLSPGDHALVEEMSEISLRCWKIFQMSGYIRVDFRVDDQNRPWVLEVNANPCLSPDAGFMAACQRGGIEYTEMVKRIIDAAS